MRLPRDVSAQRLIGALQHLGYRVVRQRGSHIRLQHMGPPAHSVSVPNHDPLKPGTLHGILTDVAEKRPTTVQALLDLL